MPVSCHKILHCLAKTLKPTESSQSGKVHGPAQVSTRGAATERTALKNRLGREVFMLSTQVQPLSLSWPVAQTCACGCMSRQGLCHRSSRIMTIILLAAERLICSALSWGVERCNVGDGHACLWRRAWEARM
jgi:hypothetical protein